MENFTNNKSLNSSISNKNPFDNIDITIKETHYTNNASTNDQNQLVNDEVDLDSFYSELDKKYIQTQ